MDWGYIRPFMLMTMWSSDALLQGTNIALDTRRGTIGLKLLQLFPNLGAECSK
jgi:hypothetical protein